MNPAAPNATAPARKAWLLVLATLAVVALLASVATSASASAKLRRCGIVHVRGENPRFPFHLSVQGHVSCAQGRRVIKAFFAGRGRRHGGPAQYQTYWTIGSWRCSNGAGTGFCSRRRGHDWIAADS